MSDVDRRRWRRLLNKNIDYYGIDIAIHNPAPNLLQADFLAAPIQFDERQFDIIVAQGVFEYVGKFQSQKLTEIKQTPKETRYVHRLVRQFRSSA